MSEEELQHKLEIGEKITGRDAAAYRKVFDALKREPDFKLPTNFADAVMNRIESKQESGKEYFLIAAGILFFVATTIITYFVTDIKVSTDSFKLQTDLSAFQFVKNYFGLFVFGAAFIIVLQWLDKQFIRPSAKHAGDLSL